VPTNVTALRPYAGFELRQLERRHMVWGLACAGALHLVFVGAWWITERFGQEAPPSHTVRVMKYSELGPPPSISAANAPAAIAVKMPVAPVKPKIAIPVPVPDEQVSPEQTIPTQEEIAMPAGGDELADAGTAIQPDIATENIEVEPPPPDFVPFEKEPAVVRRVEPQFPDAARQAGIEGSVFAKLWIDKEGKVKDVVILKSPSNLFDQPVIDAARQWVFTPAVMNSGPVAVWFPVKFTFNLQ
jgi:protein TonB